MKILGVLHFPEFGGPHNQLLRLHQPLQDRNVDLITVLPSGPGSDRLVQGGLSVRNLPLGRVRAVKDPRIQLAMAGRLPLDLWALSRLIRSERPDVVQLSSLMNPHAAYVAKVLGVPVVWQLVDTRPPRRVRQAMMLQVRRLADVIMPIGQAVAEAHPGVDGFGERSVPFFPPVDLDEFNPNGETTLRQELGIALDTNIVCVVGNINPQKGHEYFLEAAALVKREIPDTTFVIAGHLYDNHDGYFEQLKRQAAGLGLTIGRDLHFLGARRDIANVMRSSDVFVLASVPNSEGTPTVILEAMGCGLPVVATNVGSVAEVVTEGETGYVVKPLKPSEMAARIATILGDPQARRGMGETARAHALKRFSLNAYAEAHMLAYDIALRHRQRPARAGGAGRPGSERERNMGVD